MTTTARPPQAPLPAPPSGPVPAARPSALIVAHGSPADPEPQEAWLAALAVRVAMWCPGWTVRAATLAADGALAQALARLDRPVIYPFFMAEGWFTRTNLPRKLAAAGGEGLRQLPAFGHDPEMPALLARAARDGAAAQGIAPEGATLVLAAHGSQVSRASATITEEMAASLRREAGFAAVVTGYVEEAPFLADAARGIAGPAVCLPFFATRAGHVAQDVPEALAEAGFTGALLPAIGEHPDAARLIADALQAAPALQMAPA